MIDTLIEITRTPGLWVVLGFAVMAGFARGLTGFGVGLVMLPITAATFGPAVAVPVLALIDVPAALWLARTVWHNVDRREMTILLVSALAGIPGGIAVLIVVDPDVMKSGVSILVLAFVAALMMGLRLPGNPSVARSSVTGLTAGLLQGSVGLPGPPLILGWLASQVPGPRLRANTIVFFAGLMLIAVPGYGIAGLLVRDTLLTALIVFPFFIGGVLAGNRASGHVPEILFRKIVLGLVVAGAVSALLA